MPHRIGQQLCNHRYVWTLLHMLFRLWRNVKVDLTRWHHSAAICRNAHTKSQCVDVHHMPVWPVVQ